jgi:hypothetical protein
MTTKNTQWVLSGSKNIAWMIDRNSDIACSTHLEAVRNYREEKGEHQVGAAEW